MFTHKHPKINIQKHIHNHPYSQRVWAGRALGNLHTDLHTFTFSENIIRKIEMLASCKRDLKSCGGFPPYGFDPRPRH